MVWECQCKRHFHVHAVLHKHLNRLMLKRLKSSDRYKPSVLWPFACAWVIRIVCVHFQAGWHSSWPNLFLFASFRVFRFINARLLFFSFSFFFSTMLSNWVGRTSLKWPIFVECDKNQSIVSWKHWMNFVQIAVPVPLVTHTGLVMNLHWVVQVQCMILTL